MEKYHKHRQWIIRNYILDGNKRLSAPQKKSEKTVLVVYAQKRKKKEMQLNFTRYLKVETVSAPTNTAQRSQRINLSKENFLLVIIWYRSFSAINCYCRRKENYVRVYVYGVYGVLIVEEATWQDAATGTRPETHLPVHT